MSDATKKKSFAKCHTCDHEPVSFKRVMCPHCGEPGPGYVNVSLSWAQIIGMAIFIPIILFMIYIVLAMLGFLGAAGL